MDHVTCGYAWECWHFSWLLDTDTGVICLMLLGTALVLAIIEEIVRRHKP